MSAGEKGGGNLNGVEDFQTENGSSQGQNLALISIFVPKFLDCGGTLAVSVSSKGVIRS